MYPHFLTPRPTNPKAPLFIYLPGMDGTGELLSRQLKGLERGFDIRCLTIALDDLSSWEELTQQVVGLIEQALKHRPERSVYLCGESFGSCLSLKVALHAPHLVHHLILINSATAFKWHPWIYWGSYLVRPFPEPLSQWSRLGFLPFLAALNRIEADDRRTLLKAMQAVSQETSIWRISLLRSLEFMPQELQQIEQPTLLIAGKRDCLFPSVTEAKRLSDQIPRAKVHVLPYSGHACLLETGVNLFDIMKHNGFVPRLASTPAASPLPDGASLRGGEDVSMRASFQ
jgi:pimeloyl-ACP methyl ester carboxylesterase